MARPPGPIQPICTSISANDFQRYWRRAKERTSSSISGMHFGHYKAAAGNEMLSELHAFFTEILFRTGYPLQRWRHGLQVILEKKPGVLLVSKLRAILLMEADFNFGNKLYFGHRMISTALHAQQLPAELYGGVKGRRVECMALGRRLLVDTIRQKRCSGAIASVDAQSCYDRIVDSVASLCCQHWGVPSRLLEAMLLTIQGMKFYLRTGYGDSNSYYGGGHPIFQGICQGNGAGPAVWLAISAVLILILREKHSGRPIRGALSSISVLLLAFVFVDDTDLIVVDPPTMTNPTHLISRLQDLIHSWQGLLLASGGSLSADKCSWGIVAFRWQAGRWTYHTSKTLPATLSILDSTGAASPIHRVEPNESLSIVGVEQSMDGSMKGQLASLSLAIDKWSNALCSGTVPRHIAWAAINNKIWPSLRYPLSATTISKQQGRRLMGRLYKHLLPRMGSNRNLPTAVRYGPLDMAGLQLPDPYIYQGSLQVAHFIQLFGTTSNEGRLLEISLEQLQLEVGIGVPVLSSGFHQCGFLATPCWLTSLWEFISSYDIHLEVDRPPPPLCRQNDHFIMDLLLSSSELSRDDLLSANRCRLFLHLLVVSDLATGGGDIVRDDIYRVRSHLSGGISKYEWPKEHPSPHDIRNWQKCLTTIFRQTPLRLGHWLSDPHFPWQWWYDPSRDRIYRHQFNRWLEYSPSDARPTRLASLTGTRYKLSGIRSWSTRPVSLLRTTVHTFPDDRVSHEGYASFQQPGLSSLAQPAHPPSTLHDFLSSWQTPFSEILHGATFHTDGISLASAIQRSTAHGACDGSYMPSCSRSCGTSAWILEDSANPGIDQCLGTSDTPGWTDLDINAYRSELHGIYSITLAVRLIGDFHKVESGSISIYCDNETAVHLANMRESPSPKLPHSDLLRSIWDLRRKAPFSISFYHVKGHQDSLYQPGGLSRPAQLNILCDSMAKQSLVQRLGMQDPGTSFLVNSPLLGEVSRVSLRGVKLTGNIQSRIESHCTANDTRTYLTRRAILSDNLLKLVDWSSIGNYLRRKPVHVRLWATKHSYNFAATGRNLVRWGLGTDASCPCCGHHDETLHHLYECADARMVESRQTALALFSAWMISVDTHPGIVSCCFSVGLSSPDVSFQSQACAITQDAAKLQDEIGRWNTYVGRLSLLWSEIQANHYRDIGSRSRSILSWSTGMVEHIFKVGYDCWTTRNNTLHDHTLGQLSARESSLLNENIRAQFMTGTTEDLRSGDHHLITRRSLQQIICLPATHRRLWLQSISLAREQGRSQTQAEINSMASIMHRWLHPT